MGTKFHEEVEKIKDKRLLNGKSKDRVATEQITNLIIKHKLWAQVCEDIVKAEASEVKQHGY